MHSHPPVPYAAINRHGVIGDRRTAALVSADGTIDWLSLPDYDGNVIFGCLLHAQRAGYWYLGPGIRLLGTQRYVEDTTSLTTTWDLREGRLELTDVMAWPEDRTPPGREKHRAVLRRLRCVKGLAPARLLLQAACDFEPIEPTTITDNSVSLRTGHHDIELWASRPIRVHSSGVEANLQLREGEEFWCVLACAHRAADWNEKVAAKALTETERYWTHWTGKLSYKGPRRAMVRRSAILVHQLGYAPVGSHVAAPTTSLPERIGGDWNADYRLSWVRDTSLSLKALVLLGAKEEAGRYLEWVAKLISSSDPPLQTVYGIHGETELSQQERHDLEGYRGSKPVRLGNRAYRQDQHGSMGYLVDCMHAYLEQGGEWRPEFWELTRRVADYIAKHYPDESNSIWELPTKQHYLSGKVLGWTALDRACKIAAKLGQAHKAESWQAARDRLHSEVMEQGWSDHHHLGAFRQRYEGDNLDAAALLIPLVGFLPPHHPRVRSTVEKVVELLSIDGFVHRFDPLETPGIQKQQIPLGEFEGAFLPCTFWLAHVYALMGRKKEAEAILDRAEKIAGPVGLFAEGVDARSGDFLGNHPLLFSQIEYVRAVRALG
ncbi:MAG TPA: glycoside hydrolase family 15 protein [Gemmataceae bacterium]|jgi:GH15 family glucan-1,4-alpha-glucosidase